MPEVEDSRRRDTAFNLGSSLGARLYKYVAGPVALVCMVALFAIGLAMLVIR
jgi:hypothetical protein